MQRVTGMGGMFFKARDPQRLMQWYHEHLGIESEAGGASFHWRERNDPTREGFTVWNAFPHDTAYFRPSSKPFMFNFRVADLDALLTELRAAGVQVDQRTEEYSYGRFGWIMDPEGNRVELWEPPAGG